MENIEVTEVYEAPQASEVGAYAEMTLGGIGTKADVVIGRYVFDR